MKGKRAPQQDLLTKALSIIGIAVVALLLITLFKVKGGVLGIVLGTIAVAVLVYWLMEMKKIFGERKTYSKEETEWFYDLIEEGEGLVFVAKVPGPAREVKVRLVDETLEIKGGGNFMRRVDVPKGVRLQSRSYSNGILHVRLRRMENQTKKQNRQKPPKPQTKTKPSLHSPPMESQNGIPENKRYPLC